jgi:hypothetical protein
VKVAAAPLQIVVALAEILILGVKFALITAEMLADVAVVVLAQSALLVKTHVTASLFAKVELVKVAAFAPAFAPFTFH